MRLSRNFALDEMLRSQTAVRHGIDIQPGEAELANMRKLARKVLQPLRDHIEAAIFISSGFRPPALNRLIGGSDTSDHMIGCAADITAEGFTPFELANRLRVLIEDERLPVKQLIHEFGGWAHVSTWPAIAEDLEPGILTAYKAEGRTRYTFGVHEVNPKTRALA